MTPTSDESSVEQLPVDGFAHVELYVGNAKQASYVYEHAYGFTPVAYAGPETGVDDRASYVMRQGDVTIVLTAPMTPDTPIADHVAKHTDGVRDVALATNDVQTCFDKAVERGAEPVSKPETLEDEKGTVERATIATFGDTVHTFIDTSDYDGRFAPDFESTGEEAQRGVGFQEIDHTVGNVPEGEMTTWAEFYEDVFGFERFVDFDESDISTDYTALRSVVMANDDLSVKIPINEPAEGLKKSQIQEYLDFYPGPGVQHLAITTDNILDTIDTMRETGVDFLDAPETYYDNLPDRVPVDDIDEQLEDLAELGILVDQDEEGYLLQLFTNPIQDRPTLFFEVIQRKGAEGFGKGNFKALFKSFEQEQEKRGNL